MIFDKLENIDKYGFDFNFVIENLNKSEYVKGKFDISEPELFGIGIEYETKESHEALWESHRKYLDIHVVLEGEEYINISDIKQMRSSKKYEDDYELFIGNTQHSILMKPGYFLVLFPHEVHQTGIKIKTSKNVKKIVYKSAIS